MNDLNKSLNEENEEFRKEVISRLGEMSIEIRSCRSCGEPIIFLKTTKRKWMPVNMDLTSHFIDCPARDRFRKR